MTAQRGGTPHPRRRIAVLLLFALLAVLISGCTRVHVALAVGADDTVSGEVVVATPSKGQGDTGPQLRLPPRLSEAIKIEPYADGDYVGSRLVFERLTFEEFGTLSDLSPQAQGRYRLTIDRLGEQVVVTGQADLNSIGVDQADLQLKISFPGEVVTTNGDTLRGTTSWKFTPGRVNETTAKVAYADPQAPSPLRWTLLLLLAVALTSAAVVALARRDRNPPVNAAEQQ